MNGLAHITTWANTSFIGKLPLFRWNMCGPFGISESWRPFRTLSKETQTCPEKMGALKPRVSQHRLHHIGKTTSTFYFLQGDHLGNDDHPQAMIGGLKNHL